jgi:hypothetical protein
MMAAVTAVVVVPVVFGAVTAKATTINCMHSGPVVEQPGMEYVCYVKHIAQHFALAQQHLHGGAVTPGFEVDTLSAERYGQRSAVWVPFHGAVAGHCRFD